MPYVGASIISRYDLEVDSIKPRSRINRDGSTDENMKTVDGLKVTAIIEDLLIAEDFPFFTLLVFALE